MPHVSLLKKTFYLSDTGICLGLSYKPTKDVHEKFTRTQVDWKGLPRAIWISTVLKVGSPEILD